MMKRLAHRPYWRAALAVLAVATAPTLAVAQDAVDPAPGDPAGVAPPVVQTEPQWAKFCNPDPVTQEEGCVVLFQAFQGDLLISRISFSFLEADPDTIILSIMVPIGALLAPGIQLTVDSQEPIGAPYIVCDPTFCYSESNVDSAFVDVFKRGAGLTVSFLVPDFENGGAQQLDLPITLDGFTASYEGPGQDPGQAAERQARAEAARQRIIEEQEELSNQ